MRYRPETTCPTRRVDVCDIASDPVVVMDLGGPQDLKGYAPSLDASTERSARGPVGQRVSVRARFRSLFSLVAWRRMACPSELCSGGPSSCTTDRHALGVPVAQHVDRPHGRSSGGAAP